MSPDIYPPRDLFHPFILGVGIVRASLINSQIITSIRRSSASIRDLPPLLKAAAIASYQHAIHAVFLVFIVLSVVYLLAGLGIREVDMKVKMGAKRVEEEDEDGEA